MEEGLAVAGKDKAKDDGKEGKYMAVDSWRRVMSIEKMAVKKRGGGTNGLVKEDRKVAGLP